MKVRALCDCFVDSYRYKGDVFEYDGPKNPHLEPVKESAKNPDKPADSSKE